MSRIAALVVALLVVLQVSAVPPASGAVGASSPQVANGGFEEVAGNRPANWGFQDAPGVRTIVDTSVSFEGQNSLQAKLVGNQSSRAQTTVAVEPGKDYLASVWVKTENATARNWGLLVRDSDTRVRLGDIGNSMHEAYGEPGQDEVIPNVRLQNFTVGWSKVEVKFNSGNSDELKIMLAVWGATSGSVWWDGLRLVGETPPAEGIADDHEWLHMSANMLVDNVDELLERVDVAKAAGANGVLLSDSKSSNFYRMSYPGWEANMVRRFADEVRALGMELVMIMTPIGFCQPLLADNVNLATGYPVVNQQMVVQGGEPVPVQTASISNGGFEGSANGSRLKTCQLETLRFWF